MSRRFLKLLIAGSILLMSATALAEESTADELQVEQSWARDSAGRTATGAVFLAIHNGTDAPDRLLSARSDVAEKTELHTHSHEDGVMKMRQVDAIDLPAGETIELSPGGHHVMLFELESPLQEGESIPLTLTFEHAGELDVEVQVESVGASEPSRELHQHSHD